MRRTAALAMVVTLSMAAGCGDETSGLTADDPLSVSSTPPGPSPTQPESSPTAPASSPTSTEVSTPSKIPDGFLLAAGWPRGTSEPDYAGLEGPNRTLPAIEVAPCDVPADDPAYADRLRAEWQDIVDHRSRQLTLYRTEDAASAALLAIAETYRACPENPHDGGFTSHYLLEQASYGDESWSVAATETQPGGYPTTYLSVSHFIRVGTAVLVDTTYSEGGAAPPGMLDRFVRMPAVDAEPVIAAMCTFTAVAC